MDQIVLEAETKILDTWNQSLKFEFQLKSPTFFYAGKVLL